MKTPQYDFSLLLQKLDTIYPDVNDFAEAAGIDPVQFLTAIGDSDMTPEMIDTCASCLDIHPEEMSKKFQ